MKPQEELDIQILIGEYQEKLAEYVNQTIQLKTLLKQTQKREQQLMMELEGFRNQEPPMETFDGQNIQE